MKKSKRWEENQQKAESMAKKFIAILEKLDCWDNWAVILTKAIIDKKLEDKESFEDIADYMELSYGFKMFRADSIVQEMKFEAFLERLNNNPYQLKLIA